MLFFLGNNYYSHNILISLHQTFINTNNMDNLYRIKVVLVEKNNTGKWLANELGKTTCTVSKWYKKNQPNLKRLDKITKRLNVDI